METFNLASRQVSTNNLTFDGRIGKFFTKMSTNMIQEISMPTQKHVLWVYFVGTAWSVGGQLCLSVLWVYFVGTAWSVGGRLCLSVLWVYFVGTAKSVGGQLCLSVLWVYFVGSAKSVGGQSSVCQSKSVMEKSNGTMLDMVEIWKSWLKLLVPSGKMVDYGGSVAQCGDKMVEIYPDLVEIWKNGGLWWKCSIIWLINGGNLSRLGGNMVGKMVDYGRSVAQYGDKMVEIYPDLVEIWKYGRL
ncbi:hypothetical protein LOTGIDRAFT_167526 [Lottia gigantea]|uniref:Transmembrane protein n=1 Tax=Lottia gigantea TaxID=225164 RepID=V3ZYG0_LOTGI|nr:hypothetical protein LOTGIDRAFT_167526 [Lottia gigantea]ESO86021.1 hypothetical protein LOTGIDRAFT_167526 [Lottia gigantea]